MPYLFPEIAVLAVSAILLYLQDVTRDRFRRDPSPRGASRVRFVDWVGVAATLACYGTVAAMFAEAGFLLGQHYGWKDHVTSAVVPAAVGIPIAFYVRERMRLRIDRRYYEDEETATGTFPPGAGSNTPAFHVMERYAGILTRAYVLYLAETMLCGATVADGVDRPGRIAKGSYGPAFWTSITKTSLYDHVDVTSPTFRMLHGANFQIPWSDIARVDRIARRRGWRRAIAPLGGWLVVHLKTGHSRKFILPGWQDGEGLKKIFDGILAAGSAKDIPEE